MRFKMQEYTAYKFIFSELSLYKNNIVNNIVSISLFS